MNSLSWKVNNLLLSTLKILQEINTYSEKKNKNQRKHNWNFRIDQKSIQHFLPLYNYGWCTYQIWVNTKETKSGRKFPKGGSFFFLRTYSLGRGGWSVRGGGVLGGEGGSCSLGRITSTNKTIQPQLLFWFTTCLKYMNLSILLKQWTQHVVYLCSLIWINNE